MKIKSVKLTGNKCTQKCIHVANEDGLYYTDGHIITHNSVFQSGNGLNWKVVSSANSLLGMNILMGAMTEITFFKDSGKGWTDEKIFNFFTKLKQRISNRFQNNYYARMILDSSPSTLDDPIQNFMTYDAKENAENYIWQGSRWDLYPEEFPDAITVENLHEYNEKITFHKNYDVAFRLFKGGSGKPPQVCTTELEAKNFEETDLVWCPIKQVTVKGVANFRDKALENPIEFMKDFAGLPAGQAERLFYRGEWIDNCFDNNLRNIYGGIIALADKEPEHLIWDQIQSKFFYRVMDKYYYYYEPNLPRVVSVDQSKSRDCTCISVSHVERHPDLIDSHTNRPLAVYITDFTIVLLPRGGHINLDAIRYFILDLKNLGGLNLRYASFDGWQSDPARQALNRAGIKCEYVSVDTDPEPYYTYYDLVTHGRWFCGRNIFAKNNMKSLHEKRRKNTGSVKIDHFEGELNYNYEEGTWESCTAGINAKDCTDAIAGNIYLMQEHDNEFIPSKVWYQHDDIGRNYDNLKMKNDNLLKSMNLGF